MISLNWVEVGTLADIPRRGSRLVRLDGQDIALFRTGSDRVFALYDRCPHKGGPLSQGIVHGEAVTCPLHAWVIDLESGEARAPDQGCARKLPVDQTPQGRIRLGLPLALAAE